MSSTENLQLFEDQPIRTAWSDLMMKRILKNNLLILR